MIAFPFVYFSEEYEHEDQISKLPPLEPGYVYNKCSNPNCRCINKVMIRDLIELKKELPGLKEQLTKIKDPMVGIIYAPVRLYIGYDEPKLSPLKLGEIYSKCGKCGVTSKYLIQELFKLQNELKNLKEKIAMANIHILETPVNIYLCENRSVRIKTSNKNK